MKSTQLVVSLGRVLVLATGAVAVYPMGAPGRPLRTHDRYPRTFTAGFTLLVTHRTGRNADESDLGQGGSGNTSVR